MCANVCWRRRLQREELHRALADDQMVALVAHRRIPELAIQVFVRDQRLVERGRIEVDQALQEVKRLLFRKAPSDESCRSRDFSKLRAA